MISVRVLYIARTLSRFGFLIAFISFGIVKLAASDGLIDSLGKRLLTLPDNAEKIDVYFELVKAHYSGEKAMEYSRRALVLSKKLNDQERTGMSYRKIGWSYYTVFDLDSAVVYADSALSILEGTDLYKGLESAYSLKAILFMEYGQAEFAEDYFEKAYKVSVKSQNLNGQTAILNNWAILLYNTGNFEEALKKHLASLEINVKLDNKQKATQDSLVLSESNLEALADLKINYEKELLSVQNELNEVEIKQRKTGQILLAALSFILLGLLLFVLQYFRQRRNLRELEHRSVVDNKLGIISQLQHRISAILDQRKGSLELRPLNELNELMDTPLTDKEYEVLQAVAGGKTNRDIAEEQFISENTVKFHLKNIYFKLDVANRREAVKRLLSLV